MDLESIRDLQLLDALEQDSALTQRTLAARLGIALGLTNLYLKRLIRKGYIKSVSVRPNRLIYLITPRGLTRKARLTMEFMQYSLDLYRDARRHVRQNLDGRVGRQKRVAIYGTGEAAELAMLALHELGLEPVVVFDAEAGERFFGRPVVPIADHASVAFDTLIVAALHKPKKVVQELVRQGVPRRKLLLLRTDVATERPLPAASAR
ncbi:MAG: winged helix-turn-helix transcriptional regulator [Vicinamibacterales bacterium]